MTQLSASFLLLVRICNFAGAPVLARRHSPATKRKKLMRKLLFATAATLAFVASPAVARDGSGYIGVEGGLLFPNDSSIDVDPDPTDDDDAGSFDSGLDIDYRRGIDVDVIGGYDFGMFRVEGELAYKRAKLDQLELSTALQDLIEDEIGGPITEEDLDLGGRARVTSGMINALVDFGDDAGFGAYAGAGIGLAGVKVGVDDDNDSDSALAWQLIAGLRTAITQNVDLGLKYRYFRTGRLNFENELDFDGEPFDVGLRSRFSSHSLLASLIFNFASAAPPPPPPPPPPAPAPVVEQAPATITCPDGSVILATSSCPPPPPPPPPPPSAGERGQ